MTLLAPQTPAQTYWITRDSAPDGTLSEMVDVWLERPTRSNTSEGGAMWLGPGDTGIESRFQSWPLTYAYKEVHAGVPATDRECTMVGLEV